MSTPTELQAAALKRFQAGNFVVTATSKTTNEHITLRFRCWSPGKRFTSLEDAVRIYMDAGRVREEDKYESADKVGCLHNPEFMLHRTDRMQFREAPNADQVRVSLAAHLLRWMKGTEPLRDYLDLKFSSRCARCGRQITDPESIERGIGPECYSKATKSTHQQKSLLVD